MEQSPGQVEPLPHPPRETLHPLFALALEPHQLQHLVDPPALPARFQRVEVGEVAQVVEGAEPVAEPPVAPEDAAALAAHLAGMVDHVQPEHAHLAGGRQQEGAEDPEGGGLAGPVGTEQPEQLPGLDPQGDSPHRLDLQAAAHGTGGGSVSPPEVGDVDGGLAAGRGG